ncbi:MAG: GGDEF domain-containing protein [Bdellovibrionales bacterium]
MTGDLGLSQPEQWATKALEHLHRDGLRPNPNNFAVYYYYYAGTNPNLKMSVDLLLTQHGALTQDHCSELYQAHLGIEAEHKMLKEASASVEAEVSRVLHVIDKAGQESREYTKNLDSFSGKLETSDSLDQIREAVTRVVTETRSMAQQNERLAGQLAQTTQQLTEMRFNFDQAHKESQVDPLTEIGNRKYFDYELAFTTAEARDNGSSLTLLMIDIDHFKKFNDMHGHLVGDNVLRLVARTLVENLKGRDVIARYGGEEFVILLPQTKIEDAERVANLLRESLGGKQIRKRSTNETLGVVTISVGVAEYCVGEELEGFVARADAALYKAKQSGRNKVMSESLSLEQVVEIKSHRRNY